MPKKIVLFVLFLVLGLGSFATHYRAGEITYKQLGPVLYEISVVTYTDPANTGADRPELEVFFGDGKTEFVPRSNGNGQIVNGDINNTIKKNIYTVLHTYPGPGSYLIHITDPNRIDNIKNINGGNSVDVQFYVESWLKIISGIGNNQSPVLLLPPIDVGCVFEVFKHNPSAYDPDGDSLAFSIISPKRALGINVPNFTIPLHSDSFTIELNTGQVTWVKPMEAGHYNWAILIREYRGGILVGYVVRDMQVYINNNCNNSPPQISVQTDTCIEVNNLLQKTISATDPNPGQIIRIEYFGSPFVQKNSPATMTPPLPSGPSSGVFGTFKWTPSCNAIRNWPHMAVFRAVDNHDTKPLADISYWNIKVVGPSPKNVKVQEDSNGLVLTWNRDTCRTAFGYNIYRRVDSSYWKHGPCETGVPLSTGFVLYDTIKGVNNTRYFDNNFGKGISPLIRYCYVITSGYYPRDENGTRILLGENSESFASEEVCEIILRTKPMITKVSVLKTAEADGKIEVHWIRPSQLDSTQYLPPYRVQLQRSTSATSGYANIGSAIDYVNFADIKDEVQIDSLLNTISNTYYYKVLLYATKDASLRLIEESSIAGSVFLRTFNSNRSIKLSWQTETPWINTSTTVFRKNSLNGFDSIGFSTQNFYWDTGLFNGVSYCYKLETKGGYNPKFFAEPIYNFSQEVCGVPIDTIRPCAPALTVDTPCNSFTALEVKLNWVYPASCDQDVVRYRIYWKKNATENWKVLDSVSFGLNQYTDSRAELKFSIAGCYAVSAVDSFGNESYLTNEKCIDNCPFYQIPNVFTPTGDGLNDVLRPFPYRFIDKVDIIIYNRWGQEVFRTSNIDINWNGDDQKTGKPCSEGVYYYIADVYESYLEGTKKRSLKGTINIIRD